MRVGIGSGPEGSSGHRSSHYVYDTRSGAIVAAHHFAGEERVSAADWIADVLHAAHEASGVAVEHLAVLTTPELPDTDGELRVADDRDRLDRVNGPDPRIRP